MSQIPNMVCRVLPTPQLLIHALNGNYEALPCVMMSVLDHDSETHVQNPGFGSINLFSPYFLIQVLTYTKFCDSEGYILHYKQSGLLIN